MNAIDYRAQQEVEEERMMQELAICQRIARGTATYEDAMYVAWSFGLTEQFKKGE